MPRPLPDRPNLGQLKKQAKSLLHAALAGDADARRRFGTLPAFAGVSEIVPDALALHDAQSVIAREHGFPSWNALREEVEARMLSFDAAVNEFVRSATGGAARRAERLLTLHPAIATATLETALVLGDVASVEARLRENPELVSRPGGSNDWEPLLYVCHTSLAKTESARLNLLQTAQRLCALGANPNAAYHWNWHPELPRTALWGALCVVRHLPLADGLLQAGAKPTDGVSTHIAASVGNLEALDLLHRYRVDVDGIPGGVPPLVYVMQWTDNPAGPAWLLEHGANPNLAWGDAGEAPLHVAARRWDLAMVERLVQHGADLSRRRADGATPHAMAAIYGNQDVAEWLLAHGARDELSAIDRFVAACARGDRKSAQAMLVSRPSLRQELRPEHHLMLQRPAESGHPEVLETMLACGFDSRARDKEGVTALHRAAMGGHLEAVRALLRHGADVGAVDETFAAPPLVWTVQGRHRPRAGADHVGVARALIAAGSPVEWVPPAGAPSPEATLEELIDLQRAAGQRTP